MIYKTLNELIGSGADVDWQFGRSRRFLLEGDALGFTLTDTIVYAGAEVLLEYKNHIETCYCIEGEGEIESSVGNFKLYPGALYALNNHDKHLLRAKTNLRLICIFMPALIGSETHSFKSGEASSY